MPIEVKILSFAEGVEVEDPDAAIDADELTGVVTPSHGGTGVANNDAATLTRSGNHAVTITTTGVTAVTLPTSGTLETTTGAAAAASSAASSAVATHAALTATHGVAGAVVGTTDAQVLTNKTLTSPAITTPTGIVKGDVGLGNVDNTSDATKNAAAVVLTNKDIDGGTASNTSRITIPKNTYANLLALTRKEGTLGYATDHGKYYYDNGTTLLPVGSGSGSSGGRNYVPNPSAASDLTGITASGAGVTVARTTTASELPREYTTATGIKITCVSGSDHVMLAQFKLDDADFTGRVKQQYQAAIKALASYATGDLKIEIYENSASDFSGSYTQLTSLPVSDIAALDYTFKTSYDPSVYPYIEVRAKRVAGTASLVVSDQLSNGDRNVDVPGAPTRVVDLAATISQPSNLGTGSGSYTYYKVHTVGEWVYVDVKWTKDGSGGSGAGIIKFPLPTGYTFSSTGLEVTASTVSVTHTTPSTTGLAETGGDIQSDGVRIWKLGGGNGITGADIAASAQVNVQFRFLANETAGRALSVGQNDFAYYYSSGNTWGTSNASATTSQGQGGVLGGTTTPAGISFSYTFTPATPIPVGAKPVLELSPDGTHWAAVPCNFASMLVESLRYDGSNYIGAAAYLNTSGNIVVWFGKYANGTSGIWAGTWYWRVTVGLPGQVYGFGSATTTSSGFVDTAAQSFAGVKTFADGLKLDDAAGQSTLNFYAYDDTTLAAAKFKSGSGSDSSAIAIKVERIARQVTITFPRLATITPSGTANEVTFATGFSLPTWARPATQKYFPAWVYNANATWAVGMIGISTGGIINFLRDASASPFTPGSFCGFEDSAVTYSV